MTFWSSTFVMIYSTAMSLVWFKNTRRWMLHCLKGFYILAVWWLSGLVHSQPSYESCWPWTLRDEWYIVMKAYLLLYNFEILVLLLYCVSVLSLWYELYMQCQTRGVSPYSQAVFGILTASQLCITHKPIEAYPLEASLDYAGGDQPI